MRQTVRLAGTLVLSLIVAAALLATFQTARADTGDAASSSKALTPADAKSQAQQARAATQAVKAATAALQKEYEAHLKNSSAAIRSQCNFFTENKNPAVTPKAIIAALNRNYGDVPTSLYVRWQLLSGISGTVDPNLAPALLNIYDDAPIGPARPGLDPEQKAEYIRAVVGMNEADAARVNDAFSKQVAAWDAISKPFMQYRDELTTRIPVGFQLVRAEFRDAVHRASNGIDADTTMSTALSNGRNWMNDNAKLEELEQVANDVNALLQAMGVTSDAMRDDNADSTAFANADSRIAWTITYAPPITPPDPSGSIINCAGNSYGSASPKPAAGPMFPPTYLTEVAWDAKAMALEWKTGSAKLASKDELIAFRKALVDQATQPDPIKPKSTGTKG